MYHLVSHVRTWLAFYSVGRYRVGWSGQPVGYRASGVSYTEWRDDAFDALLPMRPNATRQDAEALIRQMARRWPQAFGFNAWYAVHTYLRTSG